MKTIWGKKCLLDTNILVCAYDRTSTEHAKARALLGAVIKGTFYCYIPLNVLLELAAVLTRGFGLSAQKTGHHIGLLQRDPRITILYPTSAVFAQFLVLLRQNAGVYIYDLIIAATATAYDMDYIISDDTDFAKIKHIKHYNPFRKK